MAKSQIERMLEDPSGEIGRANGAGGLLYRLWVKLLMDGNMGVTRWEELMIDFVNDPRNGIPKTKKDQTSMRGNLTKEFSRPNMTWKVFAKALMFLKVVRVDFAIKLHYEDGSTQICQDTANFRSSYRRQRMDNALPKIQEQLNRLPEIPGHNVFDEIHPLRDETVVTKQSKRRLRFQPSPVLVNPDDPSQTSE